MQNRVLCIEKGKADIVHLPMSRAAEAFELLNKKEAGKVFFIPGE
jgi:hypothetical protein